jgi:sporulation protein YlmC with PRC-barrel domain
MYLKNIEKKKVMGTQGTIVGEVEGVTFEPGSWQVNSLVMKMDNNIAKEFGIKKTFGSIRVSLPVSNIKAVTDLVMLNISKNDLANLYSSTPGRETRGEGETVGKSRAM